MRFQKILRVFLIAAALSSGQAQSLKPQPVRTTLRRMLKAVEDLPKSPETAEPAAGIQASASWLVLRLNDDTTPAAYGRSLERELALVRAAQGQSVEARAETLRAVYADIQLKHADCKQFGMGRMVKLEARTMQGAKEVGGWQVFYQWLPGRAVGEVSAQPFLSLSSPASVELPPGAYVVHAVKAVQGAETVSKALRVPVGGVRTVTVEVPVP
jgi:hypothetical protein